jgi:glutamate 5-kinase
MASRLAVVKVGTSSITTADGKLDEDEMRRLADQISAVVMGNDKIVLVTSGAVASGIAELGIAQKPSHDIVFRQAAAATGQGVLMSKYRELFKIHGVKVAQILLTAEDLSSRGSYLHTCNVLRLLLKMGIVPIINENDVTSVDELIPVTEGFKVNFSDNDILSALVANAIRAEMLIILSDVDGLYTTNPRNPKAVIIREVDNIANELENASIDGKSRTGKGGMQSKIKAAEIATRSGIPVVIANSRRENVIIDILAGKEDVGTYFRPIGKMPAVKRWIAFGASVKGEIHVNEGAKRAIIDGSSLLAVGVTKVAGQFKVGDVVSILGPDNSEFAKGNPNFNNEEINAIKGLQVIEIMKKLGNSRSKEVVARKKIHLTTKEREDFC